MVADLDGLQVFDYTIARIEAELDSHLLVDEQVRGSLVPVALRVRDLRSALEGYINRNRHITVGEMMQYHDTLVRLENKLTKMLLDKGE